MNRRSFLSRFLKATAAASVAPTVLPAATTYLRRWHRASVDSRIFVGFDPSYRCIMQPPGPGSILYAQVCHPSPAELEEIFRVHPLPKDVVWIENFSTPEHRKPKLFDFLRRVPFPDHD